MPYSIWLCTLISSRCSYVELDPEQLVRVADELRQSVAVKVIYLFGNDIMMPVPVTIG